MRVEHGRPVGIAAAVLAVMVVASACNPSNTDDGSSASEGVGGPLSGGGVAFTPFAGGGQRSVLVGFFDAAEGVNRSKAEAEKALWTVFTEAVTACMRAEGFEYYTYSYLPDEVSGLVEPVDQDGLGVVMDPDDVAILREAGAARKRADDKNAAYTASLGEDALSEYYLALEGFDPAEGPPPGGEGSGDVLSEEEEYIWTMGGPACYGEAARAGADVFDAAVAAGETNDEIDDVLRDRLGELLERYVVEVEADAVVRDALGAYQRCVIAQGWPVGLPESALALLYEPPQELVELLAAEAPDVLAALEAGEIPLEDPRVQVLRGREVEARRTHETCVGPVIDEVFTFDERFAEEHRDLVGQYVTPTG